MILHTAEVHSLREYRLHVRSNKGETGEVALPNELDGGIFEFLCDPARFVKALHAPTLISVTSDNGADLPFLFEPMTQQCGKRSVLASGMPKTK